MKASKLGVLKVCTSKGDDAFLTSGYTNWKDACGDKTGGFPRHERSQVHKYCVDVKTMTQKDVGKLSSQLEKQKASIMFLTSQQAQSLCIKGYSPSNEL